MLINYLKTAIRNILRTKVFSIINILGLSIGMAACLLIMLWVQDEMNFDKFHPERNKMYRVLSFGTKYMQEGFDGVPAALGIQAVKSFPEIEKLTFFQSAGEYLFRYGDRGFYQDNGLFSDSAFFNFFNFKFLYGNKIEALKDPYSIVFEEEVARKLFGNENPVGKTIMVGQWQLRVSGVIESIPENSTLTFKYVIPIEMLQDLNYNNLFVWNRFMFSMFVQLDENVIPDTLANKMTQLAFDNNCYQVKDGVSFRLQKFRKLHLDGDHGKWRDFFKTGDAKYVLAFSIVAFIILLNACFNYINLSTARSERRSREVAMRKVNGASRNNLIFQFLGESFLVTLISIILALILLEFLRPYFNILTQKNLVIHYTNWQFLMNLIVLVFFTSVLAGAYPAFILSAFSPIKASKNIHNSKKGGAIFRKVLVVIQFTIASILIICSVIIYKQMNFLHHKDLGFDTEHIIYVPFKENIGENYYYIKNELLKDPNINSVSASDFLWSDKSNSYRCGGCFTWDGYTKDDMIDVLIPRVDFDFMKTLNIELIRGRDFSSNILSDSVNAMIVNETLAKSIGVEDPLNLPVTFGYGDASSYQIIGIYKDIHYSTLQEEIEPQVVRVFRNPSVLSSKAVMLVKVNEKNIESALNSIEKQWNNVNKFSPFEFHFLDQTYKDLYLGDSRMSQIVTYFTLLAIIISCLGIYGLSAFMAERKTKEIGIRKVNGASVNELIWLMSKDFTTWVIIAFILATPIAWYIMNQVLINYANRINIGVFEFLLSLVLTLSIALITSVYQAIKGATMDPVKSLRYE